MSNILKINPDGTSGTMIYPLFEKEIRVMLEGESISYAEKCCDYLVSLPDKVYGELWRTCIRYCNDFLECIGEPTKSFDKDEDIKGLIFPSLLIVPPEPNNEVLVIHMELNCEWEEEHGMEWIIRNNKVLYVGAFNGEDPFADFKEKEEWNFA